VADSSSTTDNTSSRQGFIEGGVGRHLLRLGSFMAFGSVTLNIAQLAEAVYLGIVGTEALAAMGFAFPVTITLFAFAGGIGSGASSVIARAIGSGNHDQAARLVTHAQILTLLIGIILGFIGATFAEDIAENLGAEGVVQQMTVEYLQVYMLGFPFFMLGMVGSTLLRATGNAASPGIVMAVGSALQIAFGPVLIFGWFGFPEMGIAGAAWAYVASRTLSVLIYLVLLARARMLSWSFDRLLQSWKDILHVGAPAIASGLIMPVSMLIITRLLAQHGHEVVAGYNVASRVETMAHMILWSASSSVEPFVGQNWGARRYDRVKRALWLCNRFCLGWGVFTFVMMMLFGRMIVGAIDDNQVVGEVAWSFFLIIPLSIGFMGITQIANSCFNARGLPMPPLTISIVRTVVFYIPLAIWANSLWGYVGIFVATAFTNVLVGIVAWWWNRSSVEQASKASSGRLEVAR
jgi:putative MATE family efflux protein